MKSEYKATVNDQDYLHDKIIADLLSLCYTMCKAVK